MIEILYKNNDFIACIKPVGISSQNDGMIKLLKEQLNSDIFPVHRLDVQVSGVMVYALNKKSAAYLSKLIETGEFKKTYLAIIHNCPESKSGIFQDLLFKDSRKNKSFVVKKERKGVKKASLDYELLDSKNSDDKLYSLIKVNLHTGRTHQIRVQFASRKMPLIGDGKYGSNTNSKIGLFSHKISFENYEFLAYPDDAVSPWNIFLNSKGNV